MNWLNKIFNRYLLLSVFSASVLLVSCVDEKFSDNAGNDYPLTAGKSEYYYSAIKLRVNGNGNTRATQEKDIFWDKGYEGEEALYLNYDPESETPHFILFLDETETNVIDIFPLLFDEDTEKDDSDEEYTAYIKTYIEESKFLTYKDIDVTRILVVLNDNGGIYKTIKAKLSKATPETVPVSSIVCSDAKNNFFIEKEIEGETVRYFTITSSMIVDPSLKVKPAVSDTDDKLGFHLTLNAAKSDPLTIYAERMQAKYSLLINKGGYLYYLTDADLSDFVDDPDAESNPRNSLFLSPWGGPENKLKYMTSYTRSLSIDQRREINPQEGEWKINILGWDINGLETDEYYFKQIDNRSGNVVEWAATNDITNNHRYLWAKDAHYMKGEGTYPDQYREVFDYSIEKVSQNRLNIKKQRNNNVSDYQSKPATFALKYLPFNSLTDKKPVKYIAENTFHDDLINQSWLSEDEPFTTRLYIRLGSHLILSCQLIIDGFDNSTLFARETVNPTTGMAEYNIYTAQTKYLMNDIFWSEDAYKAYAVEYLGYFMLTSQNKELFGNNDGYIYKNKEGVKADGENFEIAPAQIIGGDGKVFVQPKTGRTLFRYNPEIVSENEEDKYFEIPHEQLIFLANQHDELMASCFRDGRMYYCEATKHNPNATGSIFTGDYGTVRNNWYNFILDYIKGVGNPVHEPSQALVPNHERSGNAIGLGMQLLDWHYQYEEVDVNTQPRPGHNTGGSDDDSEDSEDSDNSGQ